MGIVAGGVDQCLMNDVKLICPVALYCGVHLAHWSIVARFSKRRFLWGLPCSLSESIARFRPLLCSDTRRNFFDALGLKPYSIYKIYMCEEANIIARIRW